MSCHVLMTIAFLLVRLVFWSFVSRNWASKASKIAEPLLHLSPSHSKEDKALIQDMSPSCQICRRHNGRQLKLCLFCKKRRAYPGCRENGRLLGCWIPKTMSCRPCLQDHLAEVLGADILAAKILEFLYGSFMLKLQDHPRSSAPRCPRQDVLRSCGKVKDFKYI